MEMMDYFTRLDAKEGLFLWFVMLIAFLLGFLIAYLLRSGSVRRLRKDYEALEEAHRLQTERLQEVELQLQQRNLELQDNSRAKVELMDKVVGLEKEKDSHVVALYDTNRRLEEAQAANRSYSAVVDDLEQQVRSIQTAGYEHAGSERIVQEAASSAHLGEVQARLQSLEQQLEVLIQENRQLRTDLVTQRSAEPVVAPIVVPTAEAPSPESPTDAMDEAQALMSHDKPVLYDRIIVPDHERDDLTRMEGVGSFLEKQLNNIGVFTYEEIASWTPARIAEVTAAIGHLPGRIEKDRWVEQALQLALEKSAASASAAAPLFPTPHELEGDAPSEETPAAAYDAVDGDDDLKLIEGIGPKIEQLLRDSGINSWAALAATEPSRIKEILDQGGGQYRMHNPYTWPLQARLAAAGRWAELKEYQDELKGGREEL